MSSVRWLIAILLLSERRVDSAPSSVVTPFPAIDGSIGSPLSTVSWSSASSPAVAALITTTPAPFLFNESFTNTTCYGAGTAWSTAGPQCGGWTLEAAWFMNDGLHSISFSGEAGGLRMSAAAGQQSTDFWSAGRATPLYPTTTSYPAPVVYYDVDVRGGSWVATCFLDSITPASASFQTGLVLIDARNTNVPPFTAANADSNFMYLQFVVQPVTVGSTFAVYFNAPPTYLGNSAASFTSAVQAAGVNSFILALQYDHVAQSFSAFFRTSTTVQWTLLGVIDRTAFPSMAAYPRVGLMTKRWSGSNAAWSTVFRSVSLQFLPNTPYSDAWDPTVLRTTVNGAVGAPSSTAFVSADPAFGQDVSKLSGSVVSALAPPNAWYGASLTLATLAGGGAWNAPSLSTNMVARPPLAPRAQPCLMGLQSGANQDGSLMRFRIQFTGAPAANTQHPIGFFDCVNSHLFQAYTATEQPVIRELSWLSFSSMYSSGALRKWVDVADVYTTNNGPRLDSSQAVTGGWMDPLDAGFDVFVVLRPMAAPVDTQAVSRGGDAGFPGWTVNICPLAACAYFSVGDSSATSFAAATWAAPISITVPTVLHASINTNASMTGLGPFVRRALMFVNGRNKSSVDGPPQSVAWGRSNFGNGRAVTGLVTKNISSWTGTGYWWTRIGCGLGSNTNNAAIATTYSWKGDIFEVIIFRGSSALPGLTEAGRLSVTASLLKKYALTCPTLNAGGAIVADTSSVCSGAVDGDTCNEVCAPNAVTVRGTSNKTCAGGAWTGAPLVCALLVPACSSAAPLPAFASTCSVRLLMESWAAESLGRWNFSGTYMPFSGAHKEVVFNASSGGSLFGDMRVTPSGPAAAAPPIAVLHGSANDAWLANATAAGLNVTVSTQIRFLRGSAGIVWLFIDARNHARIRCDASTAALVLGVPSNCTLLAELVSGGGVTRISAAASAVPLAVANSISLTFNLRSGAFVASVNSSAVLTGMTKPVAATDVPGSIGLALIGDRAAAFFGPLAASAPCDAGGTASSLPPLLDGQSVTLGCSSTATPTGSATRTCSAAAGGLVPALFDCSPSSQPWSAVSASWNVTDGAPAGTLIGAPLASLLAPTLAYQVIFFTLLGGAPNAFQIGNCTGQVRVGPTTLAVLGGSSRPQSFLLAISLDVDLFALPSVYGVVNITVLPRAATVPIFSTPPPL